MRLDKASSKEISLLSRTTSASALRGSYAPGLQKRTSMHLDSADVVRDVESRPFHSNCPLQYPKASNRDATGNEIATILSARRCLLSRNSRAACSSECHC